MSVMAEQINVQKFLDIVLTKSWHKNQDIRRYDENQNGW